MNRIHFCGLTAIAVLMTTLAQAETQKAQPKQAKNQPLSKQDPIDQRLLPIHFLLWHREDLEFSQEQYDKLKSEWQETGFQLAIVGKERKEALAKLVELLDKDDFDFEAARDKFDEVLAAELQGRALGMELMLKARDQMTADQYRDALQIRDKMRPGLGTKAVALGQKRIQVKMKRIQDELKRLSANGKYPRDSAIELQKAVQSLSDGKPKACESELDKILQKLNLPVANPALVPAKAKPSSGTKR